MCEECAVTPLISELMAYEFEGGDWLIRQMAISQQLMHIDMVKGSVNVWLTASFVCSIYGFVCLSSELLMCCNLWTCRSWQIAPSEQFRDFTFPHCFSSQHHCFTFSAWGGSLNSMAYWRVMIGCMEPTLLQCLNLKLKCASCILLPSKCIVGSWPKPVIKSSMDKTGQFAVKPVHWKTWSHEGIASDS